MPIYSFICGKCAKTFDLLIGVVSERSRQECPFCGSKEITRQLSTFNVGSAPCDYNSRNPQSPCLNKSGCLNCPAH